MVVEYSVGFLHNDFDVVLVRKNRPAWQKDFLNGVGGHIEDFDADPYAAQVREFEEETGLKVEGWEHFLTLEGTTAKVHCFALYDEDSANIYRVRSTTDEQIEVWSMDGLNTKLGGSRTVPNLQWIIPLMMQRAKYSKPITIHFHGDA